MEVNHQPTKVGNAKVNMSWVFIVSEIIPIQISAAFGIHKMVWSVLKQ